MKSFFKILLCLLISVGFFFIDYNVLLLPDGIKRLTDTIVNINKDEVNTFLIDNDPYEPLIVGEDINEDKLISILKNRITSPNGFMLDGTLSSTIGDHKAIIKAQSNGVWEELLIPYHVAAGYMPNRAYVKPTYKYPTFPKTKEIDRLGDFIRQSFLTNAISVTLLDEPHTYKNGKNSCTVRFTFADGDVMNYEFYYYVRQGNSSLGDMNMGMIEIPYGANSQEIKALIAKSYNQIAIVESYQIDSHKSGYSHITLRELDGGLINYDMNYQIVYSPQILQINQVQSKGSGNGYDIGLINISNEPIYKIDELRIYGFMNDGSGEAMEIVYLSSIEFPIKPGQAITISVSLNNIDRFYLR